MFKSIIKSIMISFSLYSRIPMPVFAWEEKDMDHAIAFLPLVGAVIGAVCYGILRLVGMAEIPVFVVMVMLSLVPLLVTGGFHMDGLMDVTDARKSYLGKEKKLEIMKDPHVGAFAVIGLLIFSMIWSGSLYLLVHRAAVSGENGALALYPLLFFLSRAFCGLTCVLFPKAKKDGMLQRETGSSGRFDIVLLGIEAALGAVAMILLRPLDGGLAFLGILLFTVYYGKMCEKEFGGVTGDTAGYYVAVSEEVMVVILAIRTLL